MPPARPARMRVAMVVVACAVLVATFVPARVSAQCALTPDAGCKHSMLPPRTRIWLHDNTPSTVRNTVVWKWRRGEATSLADFGDPLHVDAYALCLYATSGETPQLLFQGTVPAGGTCGNGSPCWQQVGGYYKYRNGQARPDGLTKILLFPGTQGTASVIVKGRGPRLALPSLPLTPPVLAQLQASNGSCWEAIYRTPVANDTTQFIAGAN